MTGTNSKYPVRSLLRVFVFHVLPRRLLKPSQVEIWLYLLASANRENVVRASVKRIAEVTGRHRNTVKMALEKLEFLRLIRQVEPPVSGRAGTYRVLIHEIYFQRTDSATAKIEAKLASWAARFPESDLTQSSGNPEGIVRED